MKRPTIDELKRYANEIGYQRFDPQHFLNHYDSTGWMIGKAKMVSWKHAVRTWEHNDKQGTFQKINRPPRLSYRTRENKINDLNRRKAMLMRVEQTPRVRQELEQIRIQLFKL